VGGYFSKVLDYRIVFFFALLYYKIAKFDSYFIRHFFQVKSQQETAPSMFLKGFFGWFEW